MNSVQLSHPVWVGMGFFHLKKKIVSFKNDEVKTIVFLDIVFKTVVFKNDSISFKKNSR